MKRLGSANVGLVYACTWHVIVLTLLDLSWQMPRMELTHTSRLSKFLCYEEQWSVIVQENRRAWLPTLQWMGINWFSKEHAVFIRETKLDNPSYMKKNIPWSGIHESICIKAIVCLASTELDESCCTIYCARNLDRVLTAVAVLLACVPFSTLPAMRTVSTS